MHLQIRHQGQSDAHAQVQVWELMILLAFLGARGKGCVQAYRGPKTAPPDRQPHGNYNHLPLVNPAFPKTLPSFICWRASVNSPTTIAIGLAPNCFDHSVTRLRDGNDVTVLCLYCAHRKCYPSACIFKIFLSEKRSQT